ncbi:MULTISPECIES: FadR/GntR family transcriptional regulator [Paraburkholderia]|jgi:GntR family transcriptional repressor for pyruvate dehydrogenase complex|uniref:GntR family transcriptional regulator n=1 Tax=Paraburkholderia largidicola TaxID=3014751 RepID=A0A7I8C294_9BURK|nr:MULTISPECIES: FadR/GntR family transcriptional regulator [Paraburkholderia]BCF94755.1 GntR family transcriptional regulator [Paraburkholderia sp. PGU16]GJH03880.1 FCD domain-containing protein [Paraburkholderia terrae]CAG9253755.1 GntR family transcriptional regulator [Paraburkholderia caribensis]
MKSTEPKRLYQSVATQIIALIRKGEFPPGDRLPPERELALKLGVSRPSLREALIALEIGGQIEIRMGSGVYVRSGGSNDVESMGALGDSPSELMQARAAIEGSVAVLATARMSAAMLDRLRRTVERMRRLAAAGKSPVEADRQFHMLIAEAAGNSVLSRFVGELFDSRHDPIAAAMRGHTESAQTWTAAVQEHDEILRALQAGDPIAAQTAMRAHLRASEERWISGALKQEADPKSEGSVDQPHSRRRQRT